MSDDNGDTWAPCRKGLTVPYITCLRSAGNYLYAGVEAGGVHVLDKSMNSWMSPSDWEIQKTWYTESLAANNNVIYALTGGLGLSSIDALSNSSWNSSSGFDTKGSAYCVGAFGNGVICYSNAGFSRCRPLYPDRPYITTCSPIIRDSLSAKTGRVRPLVLNVAARFSIVFSIILLYCGVLNMVHVKWVLNTWFTGYLRMLSIPWALWCF